MLSRVKRLQTVSSVLVHLIETIDAGWKTRTLFRWSETAADYCGYPGDSSKKSWFWMNRSPIWIGMDQSF